MIKKVTVNKKILNKFWISNENMKWKYDGKQKIIINKYTIWKQEKIMK